MSSASKDTAPPFMNSRCAALSSLGGGWCSYVRYSHFVEGFSKPTLYSDPVSEAKICAVGQITISFTPISAGCSIANAIARAPSMISPDLGDRIRRPSSAPVTDDLQATVFEILVKIAASREDPEVLNGRDDWI